jgi:uncharacterized protein (TIGR02757 family)
LKKIKTSEIKSFLDEKYDLYNRISFIESDPISIPHKFSKKEDIEIAAFLAATIAWGGRTNIINNANRLMKWMGHSPYDFIKNAAREDLKPFLKFVHRTFNGEDCVFFIRSLSNIYKNHGGLENAFCDGISNTDVNAKNAIDNFRKLFFELPHESHVLKHVSDPLAGSAAKRLNMFLRWMVRKDNKSVDFGLWNKIKMSQLSIPLDLHTGNTSRKLGLLKRKQNDWKAVDELTEKLKIFDPFDPVKYDFALFGLGVFEKF